ncbi:MAG: phosphoadenosine phosphosulfate reductase family protein [Nitrosarchaeum sp.]|nr:phosphoadenosine phosphosulfate reductase family protein [Nitrosarchaeum sp.]
MKNIVAFSGGKDSLALLLWVLKSKGSKNLIVIFCDTGWESPVTYEHIQYIEKQTNLKFVRLKSSKYSDFKDLSIKRKRVPSTMARFCTSELKVKPMIDFILSLNENCIVYQGIRSDESKSRSQMNSHCQYFKYYTVPKKYKNGKPVYDDYRRKDVLKYIENFSVEVERPLFDWSAEDVFSFIASNGFEPNPLYKQGFSRVGCFPCVMCRHGEIVNIAKKFPERIEEIRKLESEIGRSFFPPNYIPKQHCSNKEYPMIDDVLKYKNVNSEQQELFDKPSCESIYNICE